MRHDDTPYSAQSGDKPISSELGEALAVLACLEVSVGDVHKFREQPDSCHGLVL